MVSFSLVAERTSVEALPPWPVLSEDAPYLVRLNADTTETEVGSVVWQLAQYNDIPVEDRPAVEIVRAIVSAESLIVPGGVVVRDATGREIVPGCCAGLEDWREWLTFEATGVTPWMGHDPDPVLERDGDTVRVWSDSGSDSAKESPYSIEIPLGEFRLALAGLQRDLRGFLTALRAWAEQYAAGQADALVARFDEAFEVNEEGSDG